MTDSSFFVIVIPWPPSGSVIRELDPQVPALSLASTFKDGYVSIEGVRGPTSTSIRGYSLGASFYKCKIILLILGSIFSALDLMFKFFECTSISSLLGLASKFLLALC